MFGTHKNIVAAPDERSETRKVLVILNNSSRKKNMQKKEKERNKLTGVQHGQLHFHFRCGTVCTGKKLKCSAGRNRL